MNHPNTPEASDYEQHHPGYRELDVKHPSANMDIRLIEPNIAHAQNSLQWLSDNQVGQYMGADFSELSLNTEAQRLQNMIDSIDEYNWMIEVDNTVIGNVCINSIAERTLKDGKRSGSMAILIGDKNTWGKGIARHVNQSVLNWAFTDGKFGHLHARIMQENIGSIKSFINLGFIQTNTETENVKGKTIVWNHYALTKDDWGNLKKKPVA